MVKISGFYNYLNNLKNILTDCFFKLILFFTNFFPGSTSNPVRQNFQKNILRIIKLKIGSDVQISPGFFIFSAGRVEIGEGSRLGYHFSIWNHSPVVIGRNLLASHGVKLIAATHESNHGRRNISGPITIGDNVWIGADVTIVGPCTIGDNAIVGAKSFVTGHIGEGVVVGGVPAKPLR